MVLSSFVTFSGKNHTLRILQINSWLIWNLISFTDELLAILKCKIFLKFKIPLIFPDRDILWPWKFPKYVSLTKEFDWWKHLLKPKKIGFWSVKHTPARYHSQWCHQLSSFHKGITATNSNFIPCLEINISDRMLTLPPVRVVIRKRVYPQRVQMYSDL